MSSLDSIERQVVRALHSIQLYGNFRDRNWSRTIFRTLAKLGDKLKYQTCASGMAEECGCGAWLYDMVWYKEGLGGTLEEVGLVLESEWSRNFGSIKFDFEKLLVAKSKYRVMIFSCPEHAISDYFDRLISIITQCKLSRKGERYLLFAVGAHGGDFEVRHYIFRGDGS